MAAFSLKTARIVGVPTPSSGSWLHFFAPSEEKKKISHGCLLAAMAISAISDQIDVPAAGREITSRIHEEYFGSPSEVPLKHLEEAIGRVVQEGQGELKIEIVAAALVGERLSAVVVNGGALVLSRKGKVALILEGNGQQTRRASGYLEEGDVILAATPTFIKMIPSGVLRAAMSSGQITEIAETLAPIIHGKPESEKAGALVAAVYPPSPSPVPVMALKKDEETAKTSLGLSQLAIFRKLFLLKNAIRRRLAGQPIAILQRLEPATRQQKMTTTVALMLLAILAISVGLGARQKSQISQEQKIKDFLVKAETKLEEAETLLTLDAAKSRLLFLDLEKSRQEIDEAGSSLLSYRQFKERLAALGEKVVREYAVEGTVFYDLELIRAKARGEQMVKQAENLVVLDKGQGLIYQIGLKNRKQLTLASGEKIAQASFWGVTAKPFVITNEGLFRLEGDKTRSVLTLAGEEKELLSTAVFANNLYLLTKDGEIFKYGETEAGFSGKRKWLTSNYPSLKEALAMTIDGSIWVLEKEGKIEKFTQGVKERLTLSGLSDSLSGASRLYTDGESDHLYVLDRERSRVVVFNKKGEYRAQYRWPKIKEATDLVVDEAEKKIFLQIESKIYAVDLK